MKRLIVLVLTALTLGSAGYAQAWWQNVPLYETQWVCVPPYYGAPCTPQPVQLQTGWQTVWVPDPVIVYAPPFAPLYPSFGFFVLFGSGIGHHHHHHGHGGRHR